MEKGRREEARRVLEKKRQEKQMKEAIEEKRAQDVAAMSGYQAEHA